MGLFDDPASPAWETLDLPGAELALASRWLGAEVADRLLAECVADIPWETHRIRIYGREVDSPRLSCWIGDPEATYVYSRTRFEPHPWTATLASIRTDVEAACATRFNSVLANYYRDGNDTMGWHSDDEPELGTHPVIASVSLGAERVFRFRLREAQEARRKSVDIRLPHGSLLRMAGATQQHYQHSLPRAPGAGARVNLTFRWIDATRR